MLLLENVSENREKWLELRKIGSSDAAAVCGISPWRTPFDVWLSLTGQAEPVEESEAMRWGTILEPIIAEEFSARTGLRVERADCLLAHAKYPWITDSPDYWVWDENGIMGTLEIKNTSAYLSQEWDEQIPDSAHCQAAHHLAVTELPYCYVCGLIGGNTLKWQRVERDPELIKTVLKTENDFWEMVESKTPPPLQSKDSGTIDKLYPVGNGESVELSPQAAKFAHEYNIAKAEEKRFKEKKDEAAANLKALIGEAEKATCENFEMKWTNVSTKRFDSKAFQAANPELYHKFVRPSTYRRFAIKETK